MCARVLTLTALAALAAPLTAQPPAEQLPVPRGQAVTVAPVYRLLATGSNDHVFTTDPNEANVLTQQGTHTYEGVAFQVFTSPQPGMLPLYRYVNGNGTHQLDTQRPPRGDPYARLEATLGYVAAGPGKGLVPLSVWVHPQLGLYFYTTHPQGEFAAQNGYAYQGALGYVAPGR